MLLDQHEYEIRCEWGSTGASTLAPGCDAVVIVDVLSFSTAVSVAVSRGAIVFPFRWGDDFGAAFAARHNAQLAGRRGTGAYSLSPTSLATIGAGERVVLPSPNGSTVSLSTGDTPTYAGCLRNARAVAAAAMRHGSRIAVIPCGERWHADSSLRPSAEDVLGAGAVISALVGRKSPEAEIALWAFERAEHDLLRCLLECSSGRELVQRGYTGDVEAAGELDADMAAPLLDEGAYQAAQREDPPGARCPDAK